MPVVVVPGTVPEGLTIRPPTPSITSATIRGAQSDVACVSAVRATVTIDPSAIDIDRDVPLIPVDELGQAGPRRRGRPDHRPRDDGRVPRPSDVDGRRSSRRSWARWPRASRSRASRRPFRSSASRVTRRTWRTSRTREPSRSRSTGARPTWTRRSGSTCRAASRPSVPRPSTSTWRFGPSPRVGPSRSASSWTGRGPIASMPCRHPRRCSPWAARPPISTASPARPSRSPRMSATSTSGADSVDLKVSLPGLTVVAISPQTVTVTVSLPTGGSSGPASSSASPGP